MNILLTGGYGFIGSNFIDLLLNKKEVDKIINVDCMTYAADINNIPICKVENHVINIKNSDAIYELLMNSNITHVVHFAAESHVDNSISSPNEFITTNINGTFSLLEASKKYGKLERFHHISTDEVYGSLGDEGYFTEITPYSPRSPYSASKAASDHLVNAYHHTYKLPITISNCSNNYGPNQNEEKLIPKIIKKIHPDGLPIVDPCRKISEYQGPCIDPGVQLAPVGSCHPASNHGIGFIKSKIRRFVGKMCCGNVAKIYPCKQCAHNLVKIGLCFSWTFFIQHQPSQGQHFTVRCLVGNIRKVI